MANSSITLDPLYAEFSISSLTEDATPSLANDFVATYDASAGVNKKVKLTNLTTPVTSDYVLITTATASDSASIVFTGLSSTYKKYVIDIINYAPATTASALMIQFSSDGGSNYITTNYASGGFITSMSANAYAANAGTTSEIMGSTTIYTNHGNINSGGALACGQIQLYDPATSRALQYVTCTGTYTNTNSTTTQRSTSIIRVENSGTFAYDCVKLYQSSGNLTVGTFKLYGVK